MPSPRHRSIAAVEVAIAAAIVLLDLLLPTLVLLAACGVSLAIRRAPVRSIGLRRVARPWRMLGQVAAIVVVWTGLQLALLLPLLEHATGSRQDVSAFASLEGDLGRLLLLLALSWTLAAVGEEIAYRGYIFTRVREAAGSGRVADVIAVVAAAALFGAAHAEQGAVGVGATFLDALLFGWLRLRYQSVWAPVLAHGISNTIGLTAYFLVGPIYALW